MNLLLKWKFEKRSDDFFFLKKRIVANSHICYWVIWIGTALMFVFVSVTFCTIYFVFVSVTFCMIYYSFSFFLVAEDDRLKHRQKLRIARRIKLLQERDKLEMRTINGINNRRHSYGWCDETKIQEALVWVMWRDRNTQWCIFILILYTETKGGFLWVSY